MAENLEEQVGAAFVDGFIRDRHPLNGRPRPTFEYNALGERVSATDALDATTTYAYDGLDRLITETLPDPDGGGALTSPVTSYEYDGVGNMTGLTDPNSNTTTYVYDDLYRLSSETNELEDSRQYTYDPVGNLLTATDRNGRVRQFSYDNLNRMIEERWMDGETTVHTISFQYDAAGRLAGASDDDSAYSYTYDDLGRAVSVDGTGRPNMPDVVLAQAFDAGGSADEPFGERGRRGGLREQLHV